MTAPSPVIRIIVADDHEVVRTGFAALLDTQPDFAVDTRGLTPANVHDTKEADNLVMGDERAIYADMAYATHARRAALKNRAIKDRIMHRPNKHHPQLPRWQRRRNALIRVARAAVERVLAVSGELLRDRDELIRGVVRERDLA